MAISFNLDQIDLQILHELQKNGRARRNKLAEIVGLSVPSVSERMKKLEEKNLIEGYHAVLNPRNFDFDITAFIFVQVDNSTYYQDFIDDCSNEPQILECHSITGDGSHFLKIRTHNTESLEKLLSRIQAMPGVKKTRTNVVLSSFKETTELPLNLNND
ncbi:MAG: Lrp/AsnC family transcriptional regulator [Balneolales bacterium]|nr:Lrp/AsnC family transcriptional regulator [Balneolales bacterium]